MDLNEAEPARDRRVRRSRAALMRAAVELVSERGTANVTVSEIAETADVSRRVVYQHFGDIDTLLLQAGLDLARRELLPCLGETPQAETGRAQVLAMARHFADHRTFYRALLTGSCAFALSRGLISLLMPVNRQAIQQLSGGQLTPRTMDDLAAMLTGGADFFVTNWVVEGDDPLDPDAFTDRLMDAMSVLMTAMSRAGREDFR